MDSVRALVVRLTDGAWFVLELTAEELAEIDHLLEMLTGPEDRHRGVMRDEWLSGFEVDSDGNVGVNRWRVRKRSIVSASVVERRGPVLVDYSG